MLMSIGPGWNNLWKCC